MLMKAFALHLVEKTLHYSGQPQELLCIILKSVSLLPNPNLILCFKISLPSANYPLTLRRRQLVHVKVIEGCCSTCILRFRDTFTPSSHMIIVEDVSAQLVRSGPTGTSNQVVRFQFHGHTVASHGTATVRTVVIVVL